MTEDGKWEIEQCSRRTETANGIKTVWNRQGEIMMTLMTIIMTATMIVFQILGTKEGKELMITPGASNTSALLGTQPLCQMKKAAPLMPATIIGTASRGW